MDKISIIINVYNGEDYISKCIESVINQTYKNLEILIINDGSTDNTLKICKSYKDKRIKIITTKNMGLSLSRNVGIDNATGNYIYFIDADDYIDLDTIKYLYNICIKYKVDIATCNPLIIFDDSYHHKSVKEQINIIDNKEMLKNVLLSKNVAGATWNKLVKKELYDNLRFQNRIINDIVVTYKLIMKTDKIAYSNLYKYYYYKHETAATVSGDNNLNRAKDFYKASMERYNNVKKIYPDMIENKIGLLRNIMRLYLVDNIEVVNYLIKHDALKYYNDLYSIKMLFANISIKDKIKLLLFRISPNIYRNIGKLYRKKYNYNK